MTIEDFLVLEASEERSQPMELIHFFRGAEDWYYTRSKFAIVFETNTYEPLALSHDTIELGGQDKPGALTVTLPTESAIGTVIQNGTSPTPISMRVIRLQFDLPNDPAIIFSGEVSAADVIGEVVTIQVLPFTARLGITIPQGLFQRTVCQWNTGDPLTCKVNLDDFTFTGTVTVIDGINVTVDGASAFDPGTGVRADMFVGGIIRKGENQGMVDIQNGDVMTLIDILPTLIVGDTVDLIAGDDRTLRTCADKFNNAGRRLAFPNMPIVNPAYGQGLKA